MKNVKKELVIPWDTHAGRLVIHHETVCFPLDVYFLSLSKQAVRPVCSLASGQSCLAEKKAEAVYTRRDTGFGALEAPRGDCTLEGKGSRDLWEG